MRGLWVLLALHFGAKVVGREVPQFLKPNNTGSQEPMQGVERGLWMCHVGGCLLFPSNLPFPFLPFPSLNNKAWGELGLLPPSFLNLLSPSFHLDLDLD